MESSFGAWGCWVSSTQRSSNLNAALVLGLEVAQLAVEPVDLALPVADELTRGAMAR